MQNSYGSSRLFMQDQITKARFKTGLNQSEFGRLLGVQISTVGRFEQGRRKPSTHYYKACVNILKTPTNELRLFIQVFRDRIVEFNPELKIKMQRPA